MFRLLDKLAGWYLDWRTHRAVSNDPELTQFELHKAEMNEHGIEIVAHAPAIAIIADQAAALLEAYNAKNYVQFDMMPRPDRGLHPVRITVQWANGMLPAEKAAKLEDALRQLIPIAEDAMGIHGDMGVYGESLYGADQAFHMRVAAEQSAVITMAKALL
jgi:hypothetical protein